MYLSSSTTFFLPPKPFVRLSSEFEAQLAVLGWSRASSSRMKVGPGHYMREGVKSDIPGNSTEITGYYRVWLKLPAKLAPPTLNGLNSNSLMIACSVLNILSSRQ